MNMVSPDSARANRVLGALPMSDYMPVVSQLEAVQLEPGQILEEPGTAASHVHFPVSCAITLVSATRDGEMSELALIGREGLVGLPALLGAPSSAMQASKAAIVRGRPEKSTSKRRPLKICGTRQQSASVGVSP